MDYICTSCNYSGQRKKVLGGSNLVSIMLWTIVPTIYGLWELQSAAPSLMSDTLGALQSMQSISFTPMDIALSVPGPIYSIWRRVKKKYVCPKCGEKIMVTVKRGLVSRDAGGTDDDLSPENLKKIPFRYAKDIEEYNKRMQESAAQTAINEDNKTKASIKPIMNENINSKSNAGTEVIESHNVDKNSW